MKYFSIAIIWTATCFAITAGIKADADGWVLAVLMLGMFGTSFAIIGHAEKEKE